MRAAAAPCACDPQLRRQPNLQMRQLSRARIQTRSLSTASAWSASSTLTPTDRSTSAALLARDSGATACARVVCVRRAW
jgi:hypothetical protein